MTKQADEVRKIKLYDICEKAKEQGVENYEITSVTDNTANVVKGSLFVCIKGARFDGHLAIKDVLEKGAVAVVTDHDTGEKNQIVVDNTRLALAEFCSAMSGNPTDKLKLIAVTGTNGKTTIAHLVKHILTELNKKCGCIGTAGNDLCDGRITESPHGTPTTPSPTTLYKWFSQMVENGAEYCVMEASSMALCQHRIADEKFLSAGFTNLTRDHLDYHLTMENYFDAKARLFTLTDNAVICIDDDYGKILAKRHRNTAITYSVKEKADIYADYIKMTATSSEFMLIDSRNEKACRVKLNMTGLYNVQNALCAIALVSADGFDITECAKALESCSGVDGRLNTVYKGDFTVITDYAHTDDALRKMLSAVKPAVEGRLICLFGGAGERDREKRPMMAKAVSEFADVLVISSDNPASEDPDTIIEEVYAGADKSLPCIKEADRRLAIEKAIAIAKKGDVIVLAGKGHERYQIIGNEYTPFCEREIVEEILSRKE